MNTFLGTCSLILWDSRTIHWNQHPSKDRAYKKLPKVRMVGYLCYVPKSRLREAGRMSRISAFENGILTTHNPANPELRYSNMSEEFRQYIENPNYIKPKIELTELGKSLLGT